MGDIGYMKRRIAFQPGLGTTLALVACSLIVGMVAGNKVAMSAPAGISARNLAVPTQTCIGGFRVSTVGAPIRPGVRNVYFCSSGAPACATGYSIQGDTGGGLTHGPRFDVGAIFLGSFVYECNLPN